MHIWKDEAGCVRVTRVMSSVAIHVKRRSASVSFSARQRVPSANKAKRMELLLTDPQTAAPLVRAERDAKPCHLPTDFLEALS